MVEKQKKSLAVSVYADEFIKLIKNTTQEHHKIAFLLAYGSGLRVSEVVKLEQRDIDMSGRKILVRQGKGSKDRVVPLPKGFKAKHLNLIPIKCGARSLEIAFKIACKRAGLLVTKPTLHFHCVSDDTSILTKEGWKNLKEIRVNDKVFSYNIKNDLIEDDEIKEINKFEYDDEMINFKNTYIDCLMSLEHRDLMNIAHIKVVDKKRVSSVWDGWKLIEINNFLNMPNKRLIKKRVSGIYNGSESIGKEKAGLLGWILTDGCISNKKGSKYYDIVIVQSYDKNREKCEIIKELLLKSGIEHSIHLQKPQKSRFNPDGRMVVFRILSKNNNLNWILKYLTPNKKPKFNLLNLKNEELQELYNMIMLGDGCWNGEFTAQNKELVEFLQILCILINRRCLISNGKHNRNGKDKLRTWITDYNEVNVLPSHINKVKYKGIIWCPTTKNNTWIAKRNNKVFITGNSLRHGFGYRCVNEGIPIHHVRTLMGHSTISTTNIYLEANPKDALKSYEDLF